MPGRKRGFFEREARWLVWLLVVPPIVAFLAAVVVPRVLRYVGVR